MLRPSGQQSLIRIWFRILATPLTQARFHLGSHRRARIVTITM